MQRLACLVGIRHLLVRAVRQLLDAFGLRKSCLCIQLRSVHALVAECEPDVATG